MRMHSAISPGRLGDIRPGHDDKPRERMARFGAQALTDAELLALILGTGSQAAPVAALSQTLLSQFGGLNGLFKASAKELLPLQGIGWAKCSAILAIKELACRMSLEPFKRGVAMTSPDAVKAFLLLELANLEHEVFVVVFLDSQHCYLGHETPFRGTLNQTAVYPREIVKRCLSRNAAAVILAHNHPSGQITPSAADESLTKTLQTALRLVDVRVLDHFVIGGNQAYSFAECGKL